MNEKLYREDFSLCKMVKENNKNIIYFSKDLIVYHMDRDFDKFLLQRFTFGMNHLILLKIFKSINLPYFSHFPLIYILFVIIHLLFIEGAIHLVF